MLLHSSQKGVALITALLIVALATVISVELSTRLQLDIRRTSNVITSDQALLHQKSAEYIAGQFLRDDRLDNTYDHLGEIWAETLTLPVEGGSITGQLTDLQGCFNLNSLSQSNTANATLSQERFNRLMQQLANPPGINLSQAIIDWIDADLTTTIPDGAEDDYYLNQEWPYRTANQPLQSPSELRLIKGFEEDAVIKQTLPWLCAFGLPAAINVNTAPEEVLESLAAGIDSAKVKDITANAPYETMNDFLTKNALTTTITDTAGLSVSSDYFLLSAEANIGQARTLMYSIIHRENNGDTQVIARSQGAY